MLDRGPPHVAVLAQRLRAGLYEVIQGRERLSLVPKTSVNDAVAGVGGSVLLCFGNGMKFISDFCIGRSAIIQILFPVF
jgi:hypothetical protein